MYVIAYDIGTTGVKTCLFSIGKGEPIKLIAGESENYDLYILDNGGVEQDPDQWWDAMCLTTKRLLQKTDIDKSDVKGISFCAQMQAVILIDKDGKHIMNSMSYMDNRGTEQIKELMHKGPKIAGMNAWKLLRSLQITGAVSGSAKDPVFKYRWVADNDPETFAKVHKWLDVKDYLAGRASGNFVMSRDSAWSTLLYDTRNNCFSEEIAKMMKVDMKHLPEIVFSTDQVGGITSEAAEELGLAGGTPVFSGGGDASLIGVGAGAVEVGNTHVYMGTSGWVCTVVDKQKLDVGTMIASLVGADPETYNCFAELETAGKCLEWARERIAKDELELYKNQPYTEEIASGETNVYSYMMEKIKNVPAGSNGVIFTPWLHGNRNPFEDPNARGMFFGLGIESTSSDMVHAVIEGVCMHLKWQMTAMEKLTPSSEVVRFVGGGALAPLTCQILADVLGKKIEIVSDPQNAGSVGAAALMGIGLGLYDSFRDIKSSVPATKTFSPRIENTAVYEDLFIIFKDLYKCNKRNFSRLRKRSGLNEK